MPWYYGWNVVGVGMTFQAITFGLTLYVYGFWVQPLTEEFGASRFDIMLGLMLLNVVMGMVAPFAGRAMDIRPIRLLIIGGAVAMSAGFFIAGAAPALWVFVAAYALLVSLGVLLAGPLASSTLAAKWFRGRRGLAIGWSSVGTSIGGLAMPAVVTWLILNEGWRSAHYAMALIVLVVIVPLVWLIVANAPEDKGIEAEPESTNPHMIAKAAKARLWSTREILSERSFWAPAIAFGFLTMVFGGVQAHLVPYVQDREVAGENPAILMSTLAFAGIIGKILFGAATDRFSHRLLFYVASAMLAGALLMLRLQPSFDVLIAASGLLGLATGGFLPLIGAVVAGHFGPIAFGRVMGLLGPFTMPVAVLGPPIAGHIFDLTGSYVRAFELFLGMIVIAGIAVAFLRNADGKSGQRAVPAE